MRKIIIIGECTLDLLFPEVPEGDSVAVGAIPGGRLLNAAAMLGDAGMEVAYVGEAARDRHGDFIVGYLDRHNVSVRSIDRFTEGVTPTNLRFGDDESRTVCIRNYPSQRFDVIWPRIDAGDIVVFGTFFAIDERVRQPLLDLLAHAQEREALLVYLPGFLPQQAPGITHVMPMILENLEMARIVVSRKGDLTTIFRDCNDASGCFSKHIEFYCPTLLDVDTADGSLTLYHRRMSERCALPPDAVALRGNAAAVASLVTAIDRMGLDSESVDSIGADGLKRLAELTASGIERFLNSDD